MSAIEPIQPTAVSSGELSRANARLIEQFYAAFLIGDPWTAAALTTPDFVMHVPGNGLNAGDYWGREGLHRFMSNIRSYTAGIFYMRVPTVAVDEHTAFTREIVTLNRRQDPAALWTLRFMMQYEIKNGLISEAWTMPEDSYIYDDFWTPGSTGGVTGEAVADLEGAMERSVQSLPDITRPTSVESKALIREFYNRFWSGDLDGMRELVSPNVVFTVPGRSHLAGAYEGWPGYLKFRDELLKLAGNRYKLDVTALAANDREAFAKEYIRMNRNWDPVVRPIEVILHFTISDNLITRINDIPVDAHAYEAFFTPGRLHSGSGR